MGEDDWVKSFVECTVHFIANKRRIISGATVQSFLEGLKVIPTSEELEEENASKLGNLGKAPPRKVEYCCLHLLPSPYGIFH